MPQVSDVIEVRKSEDGAEVLVNKVPITPTQSTTSQFKGRSPAISVFFDIFKKKFFVCIDFISDVELK
jgi:hypothetical protein